MTDKDSEHGSIAPKESGLYKRIPMKTKRGMYLSGTRFNGIKEFIFEVARRCNISYKITDSDKGFIRETVFFEIEGESSNIEKAVREFRRACE